MEVLITAWVLSLLLFSLGVCLLCEEGFKSAAGFVVSVLGVLFLILVTFAAVPQELPSGLPKTSINTGEYKVAFVYVAAENVNMGIEEVGNENERLYLYQFPKSAFDSDSMNTQAKKLVVVESGNFRRLVLK